MNEKQYRFIISNMESREQRLHVYRTWNTFKKLKPDLKLIAHHVNKRKIKVLIFMGKEDKIIRPVLAKRLSGRLNSRDVVRLLDCGHHLLQKSDEIAAIILQSE